MVAPNLRRAGGAGEREAVVARVALACWLVLVCGGVLAAGAPIPTRDVQYAFLLTTAGEARLSLPTDVAVGRDGRVYVVDSGHHRLVAFDRNGRFLFGVGQSGAGPGQLNDPVGVGTGPDGAVYVADKGNRRVQVFEPDGRFRRAFAVMHAGKPVAPVDVAVDAAGKTLYITGNTNHRVMAYTPDGRFLRAFGGEGANRGEFRYPATVAVNAAGTVFVVDVFNTRVQAFARDGRVYIAGEWGVLAGQLFRPKGVALDRRGWIYVSDSYLDVIQVFDGEYRFRHVLGRDGRPQRLTAPAGIAIDGERLYVAEMLKHRVAVYELAP